LGVLLIKKLAFSLLLLCSQAQAAFKYFDHSRVQFAGEIGFISIGLGKNITPKYSIDLLYGIVPPELSKTSTVETVTLRQSYDFFSWDRINIYSVLSIYHALGLRYQTSKAGEAPDGYYQMGSVRGLLGIGSSVLINQKSGDKFYFEATLNDQWIVSSLSNFPAKDPSNNISLGLGYIFSFN
jgi:hypothetical protein